MLLLVLCLAFSKNSVEIIVGKVMKPYRELANNWWNQIQLLKQLHICDSFLFVCLA